MKFLIPSFMLFFLLTTSCRQTVDTQAENPLKTELAAVKAQLEQTTMAVNQLKAAQDYPLVHVVFFDLREGADTAAFIEEIHKLKGIEELKNLQVGRFSDLKDPRALSQFELVMQMSFVDEAAYQSYQAHALHLALKEEAKSYLAGPPVTYDFTK